MTFKSTILARFVAPLFLSVIGLTTMNNVQAANYMPDETALHDSTWLQWPHQYTYGLSYRNRLDATWVAMTSALATSEMVRIVAYDATEKARIQNLLTLAGVPLGRISFLIKKTDDVWVRDNGPIFTLNDSRQLQITDWGFNGWGGDTRYRLDNTVPSSVAQQLGLPRIDLNKIVLEGGAFEIDGQGTFLATKSAILEPKRNPNLTQAALEANLKVQLGVKKFIWLEGAPGGKEDITDTHIDGFARFGTPDTVVTMSNSDLTYWGISQADINRLASASNVNGMRYRKVILPLTAKNVVTTYGKNLGYKGSYVNYYVANSVVLVPQYQDANDSAAKAILQKLYPTRSIVGIDVRNLFANGGMVHCVTQQQPLAH
ncbi:agmatine deiminase family protein [Thiolinea disciformis]|uniref:agmatine deiminase family protein n=1 Tax=Thiolinea disciformis TaxID=125614 RepID=UPI000362F54D|nr:agmatine deiminase family protein [Thiolinea disciformis]